MQTELLEGIVYHELQCLGAVSFIPLICGQAYTQFSTIPILGKTVRGHEDNEPNIFVRGLGFEDDVEESLVELIRNRLLTR